MTQPVRFLSKDELLAVYSQVKTATAIHIGEDAVIQDANLEMLRIWGKDSSVIGKTLEMALPELKGQPFIDMFKRVWNEGITLSGRDTPADLEVDGETKTYYFDFEYRAIKDENLKTICILHTATDVTERVLKQRLIEKAYQNKLALEREQALNEELAATNEELQQAQENLADLNAELENKVKGRTKDLEESNDNFQALNEEFLALNEELGATVEELTASNEELINSRKYLELKNAELAESETRFRSLISQAPVAICVIRASDLMIQEVNEGYLELVGKPRTELENRIVWDAVAEAAESYKPVMDQVINTGTAFKAKEHELILIRNGVPENVFIDFVYEPVKNNKGLVIAVMVVGIEVTDKVKARRSIEDVEERIRLAIEAAEMGTFDHSYRDNTMVASDRFNAIFGVDKPMTRAELFEVIHPEDRHFSVEGHYEARETGKMFYEARLIHKDGSIHWIRVQANAYFDGDGEPLRLLGTVLDITTFKHLQQQKDDFISIASHELKTPLTSLKGSLQLLDRLKDNLSAPVVPKLIEQSTKSMSKISSLVEDLLNVSRMSEGQVKLNKTAFKLARVLNDCCSHIRAAGEFELIFKGDEDLEVFADEDRIDQVIINLVNNAVKYAPDSKQIYLMVEREADTAKVSVMDYGKGIPQERLPHLFDRYYRADDSGYQVSGLGLGLYICADIINRHGGEIGVESRPGAGSTFWFTLPL